MSGGSAAQNKGKIFLEWVVLMGLTTLIFVVLYRRFLFGDGVYLYSDIGSDSLSSSFPIIAMLGQQVKSGDFSAYHLNYGLGGDSTFLLLQYINPFKFFLLFFDWQDLPRGLMIQLFLQTVFTSWFAWLFFRRRKREAWLSFLPALVWTFSGYLVLWSQNLSFGSCMLMFTMSMYVVESLLHSHDKRWSLLLMGILAVFFASNYYFYYMTGVFIVIYLLVRNGFQRVPLKETFVQAVRIFLCAVGSLFLSMMSLVLIVDNFAASSRSMDVAASAPELIVDAKRALTFLGRTFSANLLGIGNSYTGEFNYYEAAVLSTSLLVLFAVIFLLMTKKTWARTVCVLILCIFSLIVPRAWKVLNIEAAAQRFSFMVCFAECILLHDGICSWKEEMSGRKLFAATVLSELILIGVIGVLKIKGAALGLVLESREVKIVLVFAFAYGVLLLILAVFRMRKSGQTRGGFARVLAVGLTLVACLEMAAVNNDSLYLRSYVTRDAFAHGIYNDGTSDLLKENAHDTDLYRVMGEPSYNMANAGMVEGYNSTSAYSSTIPGSLVSLSKMQGTFQFSRNFFISSYPQYLQYTLLAGRYMIRDLGDYASSFSEPSLFKELARNDEGTRVLLRNENALPFGYLYTKELNYDEVMSADSVNRMLSLTDGFFYTDGEEEKENYPEGQLKTHEETDLADAITEVKDGTMAHENGIVSFDWQNPNELGEGEYNAITIHFPKMEETGTTVRSLHLGMDAGKIATLGSLPFQVFFLSDEVPVARGDFWQYFYLSSEFPEISITLPDGVNGVEIRPAQYMSHTEFTHFALDTFPNLSAELTSLKATRISDIRFADSTYSAVVNSGETSGMLCVPILYSKNWSAKVDGKTESIYSINGGLTGVPVKAGEHSVELTYRAPHVRLGAFVSIASLVIYAALWIIFTRSNQRHVGDEKRRS